MSARSETGRLMPTTNEKKTCFMSERTDTSGTMHTLVTSELEKESNRGRDASIINRCGPVDDFDCHVQHHGRHGRHQLFFSDHEIGESNGYAGERSVKKRIWVYGNTHLRRSTNWMMRTPSVELKPQISTTSPRRYRQMSSWVANTTSYRLPISTSHYFTSQK